MAAPFILKSLSAETRESYRRGIHEFFLHVGWLHPTQVTTEHVLRYRDRLIRDKRRPATVAQKLSVVRSFFSHLQAAGVMTLNPASTKLVPPPPMPAQQAGRALTPKEVRHFLAAPDKTKPEGARDYALLLIMLRLSLRLSEVCSLRRSSLGASQGRWVIKCKVKGGREEVWPLPSDVKEAIDEYLKLDHKRRQSLHSDGPNAPLFQPHSNYRTLVFDKALSPRHVQRIVAKWGKFSGVGKVTPHDLRRTVVTELLNRGHSYREVQMVTKHRDPKTVMRYDYARDNLDNNPINSFNYEPAE
ncbi:MAG TPA: tyrosine-type recombinase/integrase [Pyrinomonadaceae bacterium]|nr:tyrosine-type recombinase/integrase [Pyrinomonadaceae bacterium]